MTPRRAASIATIIVAVTACGSGEPRQASIGSARPRDTSSATVTEPSSSAAPTESPVTAVVRMPPSTIPFLAPNTFDRMTSILESVPADDRQSLAAVAAVFAAEYPASRGPVVLIAQVGDVIGVTITAGRGCVLGRLTEPIEVWYPQSEDANAEGAACSATSAAIGEFQEPPH